MPTLDTLKAELALVADELLDLADEIQPANTSAWMLDDSSNLPPDEKKALALAIRLHRRALQLHEVVAKAAMADA